MRNVIVELLPSIDIFMHAMVCLILRLAVLPYDLIGLGNYLHVHMRFNVSSKSQYSTYR